MVRVIAGWSLAIAALATVLAYICDSLYIRYKLGGANSSAALGSVQYYPAVQQKDGNLEIYYESPQNETCVHALFPHYGYNPCWYAKRKTVRLMGGRIAPDNPVTAAASMELSRTLRSEPPNRRPIFSFDGSKEI